MERKLQFGVILFLMLMPPSKVLAQRQVTIMDAAHYSSVFGESRNYRIFLPSGYDNTSDKKYPVIYFLHGWSQRYFGSGADKYAEYDKGNDKNGSALEVHLSNKFRFKDIL